MNKNCFPRSKHSAPKLHPLNTHIGKILLNLESFVWYRALQNFFKARQQHRRAREIVTADQKCNASIPINPIGFLSLPISSLSRIANRIISLAI